MVQAIQLILAGDNCWSDLTEKSIAGQLFQVVNAPLQMAVIPDGTAQKQPSVAIRLDLENGMTVVAETSLASLVSAIEAFRMKYSKTIAPVRST